MLDSNPLNTSVQDSIGKDLPQGASLNLPEGIRYIGGNLLEVKSAFIRNGEMITVSQQMESLLKSNPDLKIINMVSTSTYPNYGPGRVTNVLEMLVTFEP